MIELISPYVHYYNRGVNKAAIFFSELNYEYLVGTLYKYLLDYQIEMVAYCLMPNHYHILLKHEKALDGSRYIQRVFNAYTQAVNRQNNRVGTLFQGNVKKRYIEDDQYLAETILYIHFNPVSSRLRKSPEDWLYSDYREWIGYKKSARNVIGEREQIFGSANDYLELMSMEIGKLKDQ
jgi:REP element-mobilizing transposase RayT